MTYNGGTMDEVAYPPAPYPLGEVVRKVMRERGIGLRQMSELVGLRAAKFCDYMRGKEKTPVSVAANIAKALDMSMGETLHLQELCEVPLPDWEAIAKKQRELEDEGKLIVFRNTRTVMDRAIIKAMDEKLQEFHDFIAMNGWSDPNSLMELEELLDKTDYVPLRKSAIRTAYMAYFLNNPPVALPPQLDNLPLPYKAEDIPTLTELLDNIQQGNADA
jgi:plasmid maintenance system antidote protein VapI